MATQLSAADAGVKALAVRASLKPGRMSIQTAFTFQGKEGPGFLRGRNVSLSMEMIPHVSDGSLGLSIGRVLLGRIPLPVSAVMSLAERFFGHTLEESLPRGVSFDKGGLCLDVKSLAPDFLILQSIEIEQGFMEIHLDRSGPQ